MQCHFSNKARHIILKYDIKMIFIAIVILLCFHLIQWRYLHSKKYSDLKNNKAKEVQSILQSFSNEHVQKKTKQNMTANSNAKTLQKKLKENSVQMHVHSQIRKNCHNTSFLRSLQQYDIVSVIKQPEPYRISVHKAADIVSDTVRMGHLWEPEILTSMLRKIKIWRTQQTHNTTPLIIDIGANIGFFTSYLASEGCDVIAIEPFAINIALLKQTVCMNSGMINRVQAYKIALLDKAGIEMCLWSTNKKINNGNARLTPAFNGSRDWDNDKGVECMERIRSFTLDRLIFDISDVKLMHRPLIMKMDIEGTETKTLRGATRLLASKFAPCFIYFEHQRVPTETTGVKHDEIFQILQRGGYDIYDIQSENNPYSAKRWKQVNIGNFRADLRCRALCGCLGRFNDTAKNDNMIPRAPNHTHLLDASVRFETFRNQIFHNLILAANEGEHRRFDKGWSRMNKFLTANHGILKLGRSNIIHEWLSYQIAVVLHIDYIFLQGPGTFIHECKDMSKFEAKFANPMHYSLPVYGMLVQHLIRAEQNSPGLWKQTAKCHDPRTRHMPELSALDFVMGHIDRKANCHLMQDTVVPIDNDAVNYDISFKHFTNPDQQNILYNMMPNASIQKVLAKHLLSILPKDPFTNATLNKIKMEARHTFPCQLNDAQRVDRLLEVIQHRWRQLQSWLRT